MAWQRAALRRSSAAVVLAAVVAAVGCTRQKAFQQVDQEAKALIREKSTDARWAAPCDYNIDLDPRSRFRETYDVVRPPMPPDDPASHCFMHEVDGMKGYKHWHRDGDRPGLENPCWRQQLGQYVEMTEGGEFNLSLASAVQVARIHSPDYQDQLETLYLSALDVSTERFAFDVQFFGGLDVFYSHQGRLARGGAPRPGGERNTLSVDTTIEARKRFATAGQLLVGFANSMVWQFAGPDQYSNLSLLNFNFVQPLLRRAGREYQLEQLTIAERALLANLRALERYRQGFFTRVAVGELGVTGPQRRGGFFGGTGLTGFSGQGAGGFGGVGGATNFGRQGFTGAGGSGGGSGAGFAGGGAGTVGGYIGLLQQLQQIRNTEESLQAQLRALGLLEAHLQAGTIDLTQVDQFRQNIETERATLLQSRNALETSLDTFKTATLGLPPDLPIVLDDGMIRQFQFIDPPMSRLQNELADFLNAFGQQPAEPELEVVQAALARLAELQTVAEARFAGVQADLTRLHEALDARRDGAQPAAAEAMAAEARRLADVYAGLVERFGRSGARLTALQAELSAATRRTTADRLVQLVAEVSSIVDELSLVQAGARLEAVSVRPEPLEPAVALEIARANRLDWMNNRAALVDTWRLITYNADALQSDLSVTFAGDISTVGNSPLRFRAPTGTFRMGLQFDPPLTRLLERNNFRQVLIDYQRDRRRLIQFEDTVHQTLRQVLRDLEQLRVNLEIQRRAVAIAIRRVDQTREVLNEPPSPPEPGQPTSSLGPTAALNLLTALSDLRSSQNNLMSVWLNYYSARVRLARELGTIQIDPCGMWVDRPLGEAARASAEEVPLPPPVPPEWLDSAGRREAEATLEASPPPAPVQSAPVPLPPVPATPLPAAAAANVGTDSRGWRAKGRE